MTGRRIRVRGQVQGVGFRPFVWQLAQRFELRGEVLNDPEGVLVLAQGDKIDAFLAALRAEAPPLARVDAVEVTPHLFAAEPSDFVIAKSVGQGAETRVTPDAATCKDCVREIGEPADRRFGYAFANCTHCGPRFTILNGLPYDRAQTSMAAFEMCAACRAEYEDPGDRRFHAQPVACPDCGPRIWIEPEVAGDPIAAACAILRQGGVLAIKGLGGFHLACDALNPDAVESLRDRKHRPTKPLALMAPFETVMRFASLDDRDRVLLEDPAAPIVLLEQGGNALPNNIAPGQGQFGWMLPYTPLHHLIYRVWGGGPLVMTSGNVSGEPQVIGNEEAREKLGGFADAFIMHDRDIVRRLDDSVERITPQGPMVLRRGRGRVPGTLPLPPGFEDAPQVTAYGAHLKSAICLTKNGQALLSHHLGDLDEALTWDEFVKADADYAQLFDHDPELVACDLHPDYRSSRHAAARGLPLIEVQHHHAHLAACLAENGWPREGGPVAGIVLDGLGLGGDGTIWGGEVLLGDYAGFERAAWLCPAPLPGGDAANREPWRNLLARLDRAGLSDRADALVADYPFSLVRQSVAAGMNAPLSSSVGRLFDAFAAGLGFHGAQSFEGEAAMALEAMARTAPEGDWSDAYLLELHPETGTLDDTPLWHRWVKDLERQLAPDQMAWRFHAGLAKAFADAARELVEDGKAKAVALSGGCFQNALLLDLTVQALSGLRVMTHTRVPANDGGLALGQAMVALAQGAESN